MSANNDHSYQSNKNNSIYDITKIFQNPVQKLCLTMTPMYVFEIEQNTLYIALWE